MEAGNYKKSILVLTLSAGKTSCPFNEHVLPRVKDGKYSITLLTLFDAVVMARGFVFFSANGDVSEYVRQIRWLLLNANPEIVHSHSVHTSFLFMLARATVSLGRCIPTILTVHTSYPNLKKRHLFMMLPAFLCFDRIVFVSEASQESFPRWIRAIVGKRGKVIQNGVDIERVDSVTNRTPMRVNDKFQIIFVGRLIPAKKPETVLKVLKEIPSAELIYVGIGRLRDELEKYIDHQKLANRVTFTG
jgi:glycosyltransferase involved in cell wall biosynthesis